MGEAELPTVEPEVFDHPIKTTEVTEVAGKMDSLVPKAYQAPLLVLLALIGFLGVLGFSKLSVRKKNEGVAQKTTGEGKKSEGEDDESSQSDSQSSPARTPPRKKKKEPKVLGTITTPQGRRSGRIMAKKVEKEE